MGIRVRKRSGAWWVFIDHHGKPKAKKVGSREAAEKVKREIEARLALGDFGVLSQTDSKSETFADSACRWLELHVKTNCKLSTAMGYQQVLRANVLPRFGPVRLDQITRESVKTYMCDLAASGRFRRGTLKNILASLRAVPSHAVEEGVIASNPAFRLGRIALKDARKRRVEFLTRHEVRRFLEAAQALRPGRYPLFLTALRAGLGLGELLALEWDDIQFGESEDDPDRYILVQHNFTRGEFTSPKSGKERRVDLSKELRRVLMELRDQRMLEAFKRDEAETSKLVFPSETGGRLDGSNVYNRDFLPCLTAAGLRRVTFHALRHTFASLLLQGGASLTYVKEQMGHSSIQVTV